MSDDQGYCTLEDVRRALQETDVSFGDAELSEEFVTDAITGQTDWLERTTEHHWFEPDGLEEDDEDLVPTEPRSRDDEESIPTGGAYIAGEPVTPKTWQGSYTRIRLARRYAQTVSELLVRTPDGYVNWTEEYDGGTWPDAVGDDYYLRVNNSGVSQLYLDTENLLDDDDEPLLESYSNAVYVTYEYGKERLPKTVRRAVAFRAGAELLRDDESALGIPDNGQLVSVDTKADAMEQKAEELLEPYR